MGEAYLGPSYLGAAYLGQSYLGGAYLEPSYLGGAYLDPSYLGGAYLGPSFRKTVHLRCLTMFWTHLFRLEQNKEFSRKCHIKSFNQGD